MGRREGAGSSLATCKNLELLGFILVKNGTLLILNVLHRLMTWYLAGRRDSPKKMPSPWPKVHLALRSCDLDGCALGASGVIKLIHEHFT
jgi:hypothetical protein